jgi:predicted molibdopterin-dependent oxidoreductase YjgC
MTNSIADLAQADVLLVVGSNTSEAHPVIALRLKAAVRRGGARLILMDPRATDLESFAHLHLRLQPGTDVAVLNAMAHVVLAEGLENRAFLEARTEGLEQLTQSVREWTPQRAEAISGVPAGRVAEAARLYASAPAAAILWAMGITQHTHGTDNVIALSNLALLCGHIGRAGTGLNPLRGQNNVQGACDMGGLPNVLPGYQPVTSADARARFESAWGLPAGSLPAEPGLTVTEMMDAALDGRLRAMFVLGENPLLTDPDLGHAREALSRLEFLAVEDLFLNETAEVADVVLPGASFAEKSGTFTNTERRVQLIRPALAPPGEALPDWQILQDLAGRLGAGWKQQSPAEVFDEMAELTPSYAGMSHTRLEAGGLQWPCPSADHPGTPILHGDSFPRGRGRLMPVAYRPPAEAPSAEFPFVLTTGRILFHWHGGTLTRRSPGLSELAPQAVLEIHPDDAHRLGAIEGQPVRVSSRRGAVVAQARPSRRSPPGTVFMTFHYAEAAVNLLTSRAMDPVAKIPEYKVTAVRIEPIQEPPRRASRSARRSRRRE